MASLNKVYVIGNLTRDPDLRHTPKGTAVADLGLAINEQYKTADGSTKEEVTYVDVVVWGRQAENCKEYLTKGSPVFVEAKLQLDQWESPEGGKKSKIRLRAERVQFLGSRRGGGSSDDASGEGYSPAANRGKSQPETANYSNGNHGGNSSASDNPPSSSEPDDEIPF